MPTRSALRAVTTGVAIAAVALAGLVAVTPAASADETEVLRTLFVQDQVDTAAYVRDLTAPGRGANAWTSTFEGGSRLTAQLTLASGYQSTIRVELGPHDALGPGTFEIVAPVSNPDLPAGSVVFSTDTTCYDQHGTVTVHELSTAPATNGQAPVTSLALSFDLDCRGNPWASSHNELRIASTYPVSAVVVEGSGPVPASVVLDEASTTTLTFRNLGSQTAHLGQVSLAGARFPAPTGRSPSDGCSSTSTVAGGGPRGRGPGRCPSQLRGQRLPDLPPRPVRRRARASPTTWTTTPSRRGGR